jgi:hypothetical protein
MSLIELGKPLIEEGIRSINFFNGRLLTAKDLTREQKARQDANAYLGQAIGSGVAYGLEVIETAASTVAAPALSIAPGLAINRAGQTLKLAATAEVQIIPPVTAAGSSLEAGYFGACAPLAGGTYVAGPGVYLLTIASACTTEGSAPVSGLDPASARCNTDVIVETVQFRLLPIAYPEAEFQNEARLRNRLAYRCFGTAEPAAFLSDPFGTDLSKYGLLETLRGTLLTDQDVPLAVLYLTLSGGVRFIDNWAVRRRVTRPDSAPEWSALVGDRRLSEGEAMFLQFQSHIDWLWPPHTQRYEVKAGDIFDYLPPVGILPVSEDGKQAGVALDTFFRGLTSRGPMFIEGAKLGSLIRTALLFPPINVSSGELIWLYKVRENAKAIGGGKGDPQLYGVFVSGHVPYVGDPRFDAARWNYANYALSG